MRWQAANATILALVSLTGCDQETVRPAGDPVGLTIFEPSMGSNDVLQEALSAAPGHELIVADLRLGPDAVGDPHSHPWEEYLYVIGGSAVLDVEGAERRTVHAGETAIIPARTVHTPRAGAEGIRAIVLRVHNRGDPLNIPADESHAVTDGS